MTQDNRHNTSGPGSTIESPTLRQLRETLTPLYQDNPTAMCITNRKGQVFYGNQAFITGLDKNYELSTIKGHALHSLFPHQSHRAIDHIESLINDKRSETLQKNLHLGTEHIPTALTIRVQILRNSDDQRAEGALITFQENASWYRAQHNEDKKILTDRIRQLSTDLMDRQSLLKAMMDHSPFGIVLLDKQRRVIQMNRTSENILGIPRSEARGILCNNLFQCFEQDQRCPILEDGKNVTQQETACGRHGKTQQTFLRSAVHSRERNEDIIIEAFIDITDMKGAQQAEEAAYRAKDDFFAKMSHELRTPLNAVIGYSELLVDDTFPLEPDELKEYAGAIQRGGYDLLHLVDRVLNIAKIDDNKMEIDAQTLHPGSVLEAVISTIQPMASKNQNQLSTHGDTEAGTVYADPEHLQAILLNLLSNACKFTDHGEISATIQREIDTDGEWVIFEIKDTGIGLTEEQAERIFNRFEQADNSGTRNYAGSGLGLSIAKDLTELMGGRIEVKSTIGEGSTFTVRLPGQVT